MRLLIILTLPLLLITACRQGKIDRTDEFADIVEKGKAEYESGDYNKALLTFQKMMNDIDFETESIDDERLLIAQMLLGNIHLAYNDYTGATGYYRNAFKLVKKIGPPEREMRIMTNLGGASLYAGDSLTIRQMKKEIDSLKGCDSIEQGYYSKMLEGLYEDKYGDRIKSLKIMKELLKYVEGKGMNSRWKLTPLSSISTYYTDFGPNDSAFHYIDIYEKLAQQYSVSNMTIDAKRLLVRLNARAGKTEEVLRQQQEYDALIDSLMDPNRFLNFKTGTAKEAQAKGEKKIASLTMRVSILQIVILGLVVVLGVGGMILYFRSKSRYFNHELFNRNRELVEIEERNRELVEIEERHQHPQISTDENKSEILMEQIKNFFSTSEEYLQPDFSLNTLAERLGSNTKYVSTAINETGTNFRNFLNEYRIREARRRLLDAEEYGNMTIQGIAESVGFLSTSTFNAAFKKFTGMTPTLYQKHSREAKGL